MPMNEWPLVLTVLGLMIAIGTGLINLALAFGGMKERVRTLEEARSAMDAKIEMQQRQLVDGGKTFVEMKAVLNGLTEKIDEIKDDLEKVISGRGA